MELKRMVLDPEPGNVREARRFVQTSLAGTDFDDLADLVVLLTSELVTNSFLHAASQVTVTVGVVDAALQVEVTDWGGGEPEVVSAERFSTGGRGLALVDTLANDWGVERDAESKSVWFRLAR